MSSLLRSMSTPAGYFVMSSDTILDGSAFGFYDLSAAATYNNNGTVLTRAQLQLNTRFKDSLYDTAKSVVTLKDLGKTEYGAQLWSEGGAASQGITDVRKVAVVGDSTVSNSYYVSLGTNLRNAAPRTSPGYVSTLKPSVALVGKPL